MRTGFRQSNNAFTLMEVMLVIAILGIISVIAVPSMVKSIRGNRLRLAARSVVVSGKYARSMAVMQQRDVTLSIDVEKGVISVSETHVPAPPPEKEDETEQAPEVFDDGDELAPSGPGGTVSLERILHMVYIKSVDTAGGVSAETGAYRITYRRNGRCTPYSVLLVDDHGDQIHIEVDALGSVRTESR